MYKIPCEHGLVIFSIALSFLSAVIFISYDLPLIKFIPQLYFRSLDESIRELRIFYEISTVGPRKAIIRPTESTFKPIAKVIEIYFPDVFFNNKKGYSIVSEASLAMSATEEVSPNPISIWFEGETKPTVITSLGELRMIVQDYKQRILNRFGIFLLSISIILQILQLYFHPNQII